MVIILSSEPEAMRVPFGENLTTFVFYIASLSPYKILIFSLVDMLVIYHILIQPSVPSSYYYLNFRSSEPAVAN